MTPTKDLATKDAAGLPTVPGDYMDNFPQGYDESDHILPVISIIQPNSGPEKKKFGSEGQWASRDGTAYDTLRLILLSMQYTRGIRHDFEGHDSDRPMYICRSEDRKTGYPTEANNNIGPDGKQIDYQFNPAGREVVTCSECPRFSDDKNWVEKGCRHMYTLRCFDLEAKRPFAYFVYGSAMSPIKATIVDRVTPREGPNGYYIEKPFWWAEFELETVIKQTKGSFYVPVPRVVKELSPEEQAMYAGMYGTVREASIEEEREVQQRLDDDPAS